MAPGGSFSRAVSAVRYFVEATLEHMRLLPEGAKAGALFRLIFDESQRVISFFSRDVVTAVLLSPPLRGAIQTQPTEWLESQDASAQASGLSISVRRLQRADIHLLLVFISRLWMSLTPCA